MKRFQELIAQDKNKKQEKLTFRALSNTIDFEKIKKQKKQKINGISFKELANEAKKNNLIPAPLPPIEIVEFTLKKDKK